MNADRSNIVVFPTWAGGTTEELKDNVGAGKLISDADYYVILIDALANGVSSSPSNSTVQPHMKFPEDHRARHGQHRARTRSPRSSASITSKP